MAKKKGGDDIDDLDMDFDDLDGMDDMEFDDVDFDRKPSNSEVAKDLGKEAGTGFLDGLAKQTAKKVLPESYEYGVPEAMEYVDFSKEVIGKNKTKIEKSIYGLGKEVKKILPFQSKMLDGFLEKYSSDFEKHKQESEEAIREASIGGNLTSIFDKQLEVQKAIESRRDATNEVESKQRMVSSKMQLDLLKSIAEQTGQQAAFTTQIGKEYYRKSLELQFKTYYIQADMLKTQRDYFQGFSTQFDTIVKNTGLPDFVKLHNTELIAETMKRRAIESTTKRIFDNSTFIKGAKERINRLVDQKVSAITESIDQVTGGMEMMGGTGGNPIMMMASVLSSLGGSTLGGKLADKVAPGLKERIKDNKTINAGGQYLDAMSNDPKALLEMLKETSDRKKDSYSGESSPVEGFLSKLFGGTSGLLDAAIGGKDKYAVKNKSNILENKQPAIFDQRVHRSITEVIPMYLMRILKQNTDLTSMYFAVNKTKDGFSDFKASGELMYDYNKRKLDSVGNVRKGLQDELFGSRTKKMEQVSRSLVSSTISSLDKDPKKNKALLKTMKDKNTVKGLHRYAKAMGDVEGFELSYESLVDEALDDNKRSVAASEFFAEHPEVLESLKIIQKSNNSDSQKKNLDINIKDATVMYPIGDIIRAIHEVSKLAGKKPLNSISDAQATVLSKSWTTYIVKSGGSAITFIKVIKGEVFNNTMTESDLNIVSKPVAILVSELTYLVNLQDREINAKLNNIFTLVNKALKANTNLNPEIWSILNEYSNELVADGELGTTNLVEGSLDVAGDDTEYASADNIKKLTKVGSAQIKEFKKGNTLEAITRDMGNLGSNFKNTFKKAADAASRGDLKGAGNILADASKELSDGVKAKYRNHSKLINSHVTKFTASINKLTEKTVGAAIETQIKAITGTIEGIDRHILTSKEAKELVASQMSDYKNAMSNMTDSESSAREVEKTLKESNARYDAEIARLESAKSIIANFRQKLIALQDRDAEMDYKALATQVSGYLTGVKEQLTGLVENSKRISAASA